MSDFVPISRPDGHPLVRIDFVDGDVAVLTLADPAQRNALTVEMSMDLATAVEVVRSAGVGALVLTAEPPVFCSGGQLDDLITPRAPLEVAHVGFRAIAKLPVVTIAAVDGAAIGAGVNLPLACDVVLAGENASFDPRLLDLGIHPAGGHYWRLIQRIGRQGAVALSLCGDVLTGDEAETKGLVWRSMPSSELMPTALRFARRAAGRPRDVMLQAKRTLEEALTTVDAESAFDLEFDLQRESLGDPALIERVTALQERLRRRD
jgi:enoyl-CoA hydratase